MLGKIVSIKNSMVYVQLSINVYDVDNMIYQNVTFNDRYIGEIMSASNGMLEISLIGEIVNNFFLPGGNAIPPFGASVRLTTKEELDTIYSISSDANVIRVGEALAYKNYEVSLNINNFFANHFAIFGGSGSGKSHFVARLLQGIFYDAKRLPFNTNIFLFDAYGEYQQAFTEIGKVNPNINYKVITTDLKNNEFNHLTIPFWLLSVDDICLLLNVDDPKQIAIVDKALKLVSYFSNNSDNVINQKNDIVARCLLDIIFSTTSAMEARNKIVTVLTKFGTDSINLEIGLTKGGWTRSIRQCIAVEENGKFTDVEIVINYLEQFCLDDFELSFPDGKIMYTINDFYKSLEFALISEGVFNSGKVVDYANILKIRLNTLINSDYANYFKYDNFIDRVSYIKSLLTNNAGNKCQIVNFNINYVDDRFAKNLVKIYSKLLFDFMVKLPKRASMPFHIILEEAHRYVQDDIDKRILGYNIFERIAKEGRKYGMILGVISQRPLEISETVISQVSNFALFKMFHPDDVEFITSSIAGINDNMINKIKVLNPGNCVLFGSAFKFPIFTAVDMPNPTPLSQSCDINKTWYVN